MAEKNTDNNRLLRELTICGFTLIVGYTGLFCLMQSPVFWYVTRPDPLHNIFPEVFRLVDEAFPQWWLQMDRTDGIALITVPIYLAVVVLITGPLLYLLRRLTPTGLSGQMRQTRLLQPVQPELKKPILRRVFGFTIAIMVILLFVRGLFSTDIYVYTWYPRIWIEHNASPYTHTPVDFAQSDPEGSLHWIHGPKEPAVYGPAWLLISAAFYEAAQLFGGSFTAKLLWLRLLADGAHLLNGWLVWSIAGLIAAMYRRNSNHAPRTREGEPHPLKTFRLGVSSTAESEERDCTVWQLAALLLYIWNPLLMVEFGLSGHNDVVMLTFVLLAVWLYLKSWWRLAALALGMAALVKLPALMFLPGYVWLLLGEEARPARGHGVERLASGAWRGAQALTIVLLAWVVLYVPFWEGPRILKAPLSGPANRFYLHSLASDIRRNIPELLANVAGTPDGREQSIKAARHFLGTNLRKWFMGLLAVVALAVTWRARTFSRMLTAWGWVAIAAMIAQGWFWPWYVSWAVVPAAIAPSKRLSNATLVLTVSALLHYIEEQVLGQHFSLFLDWSGVLIFAPPLVYIVWSLLSDKQKYHSQGGIRVGAPRFERGTS